VFISLVAFAYLEQDGALLSLALIAALVLLAVIIPGAIWGLTTL
jgi:heme/copper-type cytochrome/quinol oxidase subunit 4